MKAWMLHDHGKPNFEDNLDPDQVLSGDVRIRVHHSTLNYKDALALTGKAKIARSFPLIPGIDLAGEVLSSPDHGPAVGTRVLVNGFGLGESRHGGYAEQAAVDAGMVLAIPERFSFEEAMSVGTAGYTAALCVLAVEEGGARPGTGSVLVTGATGGVGSIAVHLLAQRGHRVLAVTGRPEHTEHLQKLGAAEVLPRSEFGGKIKPLAKQSWFAAIDVAGSTTLGHVLSRTEYGGVVAATGLAEGMDLAGFVTPFILRNVRLQGVDSVETPMARREAAWKLLDDNLETEILKENRTLVSLSEVRDSASALLEGKIRGRVVVSVSA